MENGDDGSPDFLRTAKAGKTHESSESSVGILESSGDLELLDDGLDLAYEANDGVVLFVSLAEGGLERGVSVHKALYFLHRMDDEHVD